MAAPPGFGRRPRLVIITASWPASTSRPLRQDDEGHRSRVALYIGVAHGLAHLDAHLVLGRQEGSLEPVVYGELAVMAGPVTAKCQPAMPLAHLEDDHHSVVVGAGDAAPQ